MKLIDKDALVAEIERIEYETNYETFTDEVLGKRKVCKDIKDYLDTLEVKEIDTEQLNKLLNWWKEVTSDYSAYKVKGVDLEKEMSEYFVEHSDEFFSDKYNMSKAEEFIKDYTRNCSNQSEWSVETPNKSIICVQPWLTPDQALRAVEIAKEETLDKVCKYIKDNLYKNLYVYNGEAGFPTFQFIEDLKQAIKDE